MASNNYKVNKRNKSTKSLFSMLQSHLKMDTLFDGGLPVKFVPHTLFLMFLAIIYIGSNHWAEKTIRKINKIQAEVEELRADYTSLKSDYMFASKQSEVARKVKNAGLKESSTPPNKIIVKKGEY